MIELRPVQFDDTSLVRYGALFATCFSQNPKFGVDSLRWLYRENPDGHVMGFDAWDEGELAGHYVCVPAAVRVGGRLERSLLSLNTATHPRWQGQGLFTRLATSTYEAAAGAGFESVYGVANANSTPGFVRKMGFQLVAPLEAKIGVGRLGVDVHVAAAQAQFARIWSPAALRWRCANPSNPVSIRRGPDGSRRCHARGPALMVSAYAELPGRDGDDASDPAGTPLHLHLGLTPLVAGRVRGYVDIPKRLRPSPLNLIFKDLTHRERHLDASGVSFSFLDFDAF